VALDGAGNLFIFDVPNRRIRKISPDGIITTLILVGGNNIFVALDSAGNTFIACPWNTLSSICEVSPDGAISTVATQPASPLSVAVDSGGNLFIADTGSNRIRKVTQDGIITTIAGKGSKGYSGDGGPAAEAQLSAPEVVAADAAGNVFIADYTSARIRKVSAERDHHNDRWKWLKGLLR
jgi:sugar lactone lactonase YvrE